MSEIPSESRNAGEENPFSSPADVSGVSHSLDRFDEITPGSVEALRQTRPWVMVMGIVGIILGALTGCGGAVFAVFALPAMDRQASDAMPFDGFPLAMSAMYILMAAFYVVPSILLLKYASRISEFVRFPNGQNLEQALLSQRAFWRLIGIALVVVIGLYVLVMVVMMLVAAFAAAG